MFDENYDNLTASKVAAATESALSDMNPAAVAVCGWTLPESRAAISWARRQGRAVILMSATKSDDFPRRFLRESVKRRIVRLCDSALVGGTPHREYMIDLGMPPENVFTGYDAVGNEFLSQQAGKILSDSTIDRGKLGIGSKPFFLASNRFIPRKNLPGLVSAYARYRRLVGDEAWDMVLLGDGPDREAVERQIAEERAKGILLPGFRQIDELPAYYALAACFVHPALQEQWGLVVNEALACGLPVLVSQTAGCRYDLVEPGVNGWLFDPASIDSMAGALIRMHRLDDAERKEMSERSREVVARWGPERFARGLHDALHAGLAHCARRRHGLKVLDHLILQV